MKNRRFLLILLFSLFLPAYSRGQENDDGGEGVDYYLYAGEAEAWEPTQEERLLELEIRTSSLPELAAWSRTLGLPEAGTRAELAARLRAHFNLDFTTEQDDAGRRIITIESARVTEYFTIEIVDEEFARLSGGVSISLIDGEATHRISAQEILFNRTRNILTARGGVEYLREEGGTTESFRGDSITVDLDNWTSVFLDGASYRALGGEGGTFSIEGRVITAGNEDVTIIEGATIRNAENPEALWSITASRLWLLPGSDFAIFNAFLRVGEIPVLYIPFFYYPASEIVFRPVLGFRSREGAFVQTTTYLLGRPTREGTAESSLTRLLGADPDAEMVLEGIFLRNTGRLVQDPQTTSLSVLLDYYTSLGFYFGLEFSTPAVGILSNFDISLGIGLTRTIFQDGLFHTPFAPDEDHFISGQSDWNRSNLFGWDVPFRYRFRLSSAVSGSLGGFSWSIPFYSDPFVDMDFMERSTAMDWLGMAQQGVAITEQDRLLMQIPAYQWELSGNLHFGSLIGGLSPFISTLALTSITSTVFFNSVNMPTNHPNFNPHSPSRAFFSPDRFQIYSVTGVISGTLFSRSGFQFTPPAAPEPEHDFGVIGTPRSPWQRDDDEEDAPPHASSIPQLAPPPLNQAFHAPGRGWLVFSSGYQFTGTSTSDLQFRSGEWQAQDEVDWGTQSLLWSLGGSGSLNFHLNHSQNLFTNTFSILGTGMWRQFGFMDEEADAFATQALRDAARLREYSQMHYTTHFLYTGTLRPFINSEVWGMTNFQYSLRGTLVRSRFDTAGSTGDDPRWDHIFPAWNRDEIQVHQFAANFQANIRDHIQNVSFVAELPPLESAVSANATFRKWISETNARVRVVNPTEPERRVVQPLFITETWRFGDVGSLVHFMVFEPELDNEFSTVTTTLNLWHWGFSFAATRMLGSELIYDANTTDPRGTGWHTLDGDPTLRPRDFTISYNRNFAQTELIPDRLSFAININSNTIFDIQRYTNSRFNFTYGFTLGFGRFMDLSISATSDNAVIMRYFRNLPGFEFLHGVYAIDDRRNNVFLDLMDSFNFMDEEARRRSGFKMRSFNLSATYFLGDWNAILSVSMSPFQPQPLPGAAPQTVITSEISFVVQWIPISEIRSSMAYDGRANRWTVGQ